MEIDAYEKQLLNTARLVLKDSPYLNRTKKVLIDRLFSEIERIYKEETYE